MTWARRLKREFGINIETCEHGGDTVKITASIQDPLVIAKILEHLQRREAARYADQASRTPQSQPLSRAIE